jgi:hypothetical protein
MAISTPLLADSLSEAFEKLEVKGEIKTAYVDSNFFGAPKSDSVFAIGGNLGVVTGSYYGFKAGATFQTSSVLSDDVDNGNASPFNVNNVSKRTHYFDASGAVLSEAYLQYSIANTSLKVGRQFIYTPLVSTGLEGKSSEAIIKDSFEAYILTNTDLPDTTIVAGYVSKWQPQSDGLGNTGDFVKVEDGAYTIYAKNTSIENLTLQAQYLDINGQTSSGDKDALYLQADYQAGPHTLSAQFLSSTDKSQASNAQDGTLYGLKATGPLGLGKLGYLVAFNSSTDKDAGVFTGAGEGVTDTPFTAMPVHDGGLPARPDTDTLVGAIVVPFSNFTFIPYGGKSMSKTHPLGDVTAFGAMAIYPIAKNLLLKANYEHVECENIITEDTDTTRIYLSYKF